MTVASNDYSSNNVTGLRQATVNNHVNNGVTFCNLLYVW